MEYHDCEICDEVIHHKLYRIFIKEFDLNAEEKKDHSIISYGNQDYLRQVMEGIKMYEVCEGCKKAYDLLLKMRAEDLKVLTEKAKKIFKKSGLL